MVRVLAKLRMASRTMPMPLSSDAFSCNITCISTQTPQMGSEMSSTDNKTKCREKYVQLPQHYILALLFSKNIHCRQGIIFEASERSRSLSLAQINSLGSDLSLASIAKIARCLQLYVLTRSFLSIRFTRKVYSLYNEVFGLQ